MEERGSQRRSHQQNWDSYNATRMDVLNQLSQEALKFAGDGMPTTAPGSPNMNPRVEAPPRHRRARSEVISSSHDHTNSSNNLQKLKFQMHKALNWGSRSFREGRHFTSFDPEILANQKRQWYQLKSKTVDPEKYKEPTTLFEHFVVVGLHPDAKLASVEDEFVKKKKWEQEMQRTEDSDYDLRSQQPTAPTLEPEVLFQYPPGKKLTMQLKDLSAFCFPEGVKAHIIERTPSLSELNQLVYGQEHLHRDDLSFIFSLKVADSATLYGVCLHVQEVVQKPPVIYGAPLLCQSLTRRSRFLVSAPRCYCLLTRVPFFEIHYEMLNSIISQERLNRITRFAKNMTQVDSAPSLHLSKDHTNEKIDSPNAENSTDWTASAIPVDSAEPLAAAAIRSDGDTSGLCQTRELDKDGNKNLQTSDNHSTETSELQSIGGETPEHCPDICTTNHLDKDDNKNLHTSDNCSSEPSELQSIGGQTPDLSTDRDHLNKDGRKNLRTSDNCSSETSELQSIGGHTPDPVPDICSSNLLSKSHSFESLFSPAGSLLLSLENKFYNNDEELRDNMIMKWAKEKKNDTLQIICGYHHLRIPQRGDNMVFQPLEHLQGIVYQRPSISALGLDDCYINGKLKDSAEAPEVKFKLATAEEAVTLALWSTATICRVLSVESILGLINGVLLEKQVVVQCPNLGILSAVVLSLTPIIRPFEWQSLFLPILPGKMLDFLDAPVPFIVGVQHKPHDLKAKASNLVRVDVLKNKVKSCTLPPLPRRKELIAELRPIHSKLSCQVSVAQKHPVYKCNEVQVEAATQFLCVMRWYMESLCTDMLFHTITSVQNNDYRVCLLLKDSFIESFPLKDQPFIKLFVETQLFTVMSDTRISVYENE